MTIQLREVKPEPAAERDEERQKHDQVQMPKASSGSEAATTRSGATETVPGPQPGYPDKDLEARIDKLQNAANAASAHARGVYVTFLLFGLYLAIIFGSTTHEQLLRESPVTLPLLNVGLPLMGFYWVAPALFVLLHLNLLIQLYLLSQKLHRLDRALRAIGSRGLGEDHLTQLHPFPFSQMLIGRQDGRLMRFLLWLMVWLTVLVLPVVLLLAGQVRFLPYHDAWTTTWHRFLVTADVLLILIFWRAIRHPRHRLLTCPHDWLWHQMKALPLALAALTLSLLVFTFPGDAERLGSGSISMPDEVEPSLGPEKSLGPEEKVDVGDPMEEWVLAVAPESLIDRSGSQPSLWATRYLFERLPFLARNLLVRETNLVGSWPTQAQIEQHGEKLAWQNFGAPPNLRHRDLRYADLSESILARGDLRNANLQEAELWGTNLEDADLLNANLQTAQLQDANLQGASLAGANLQGGNLWGVDFQGATLVNINLQGADLALASLQGADLWNANLQTARLTGANLQGASLLGADLQGAVLWGANLQGAVLGGLKLHGAVALRADLLGTVPSAVNVPSANLQGADLRGAHLWRALLDDGGNPDDRWVLADLRGVNVDPIEDLDAWIEEATQQIANERTRNRVAEQLRAALRNDDRPEAPRFPDGWRSSPRIMLNPADPLPQRLGWGAPAWATVDAYDQDLGAFLGELACGATVHVAKGLAGRVRSDSNRLYAKHLAARLTGDDCAPAAELSNDIRATLEQLAAGAVPAESPEDPLEE